MKDFILIEDSAMPWMFTRSEDIAQILDNYFNMGYDEGSKRIHIHFGENFGLLLVSSSYVDSVTTKDIVGVCELLSIEHYEFLLEEDEFDCHVRDLLDELHDLVKITLDRDCIHASN